MGDNRASDQTSGKIEKELEDKRYSIILFLMAIVTFLGLIKLKNQFKPPVFFIYMLIGSFAGWSWQIFVTYLDPAYSGWWYEPHKIWGSVGLVAYEDVAFYPICGALFYLVRLIMPSVKTSQKLSRVLKISTVSIALGMCVASLFIFNIGGKSSTYWFLIPGIGLYLYTFKEINITKFLFTGLFIIVMASAWDLWIKDWLYITSDLHQSKIWLNYKIHPWAWVNRSPIEITPWFSICGWIFIYPLAQACEKKINL